MPDLSTETEKFIASLPKSIQKSAIKAFAGNSKSAAIKVKCITCVQLPAGFSDFRIRIENCKAELCPLHFYRPYQPKINNEPDEVKREPEATLEKGPPHG